MKDGGESMMRAVTMFGGNSGYGHGDGRGQQCNCNCELEQHSDGISESRDGIRAFKSLIHTACWREHDQTCSSGTR